MQHNTITPSPSYMTVAMIFDANDGGRTTHCTFQAPTTITTFASTNSAPITARSVRVHQTASKHSQDTICPVATTGPGGVAENSIAIGASLGGMAALPLMGVVMGWVYTCHNYRKKLTEMRICTM